MSQKNESKRLSEVDGLRGFAALYVLVFHYFINVDLGFRVIDGLIHYGHAAVPLFFVISGYLIHGSAERKFAADPYWRTNFYIGRAFRILPLWWALLVFMLAAHMLSLRAFFANASFVFGFLSFDPQFLPIIPAWSLFVEECFYCFYPFVKSRAKGGFDLFLICIFFIVLSRVWCEQAAVWGLPTSNDFIWRSPLANFQYLFLGVLMSCFSNNPAFTSTLKTVQFKQACLFDLLALVSFFAPAVKVWVPIELSCGLLVVSALYGRGFLAKLWRWGPLCWAGRRCYAIYISHVIFINTSSRIKFELGSLLHLSGIRLELCWLPFIFSAILVFSEISWVYWEQPWQQLGKRLMLGRGMAVSCPGPL